MSFKDRTNFNNLRGRLNLNNIEVSVHNRRLLWFGHIQRMDESALVRCKTVEEAGSVSMGRPGKTCEEVIRM